MTDPVHRHVRALVDRLLELEDDQDSIRDLPHRPHAPRTPGPQLRADVVDDRDTEASDRARQPEVEVRKVDRHEHVRTPFGGVADEPPIHRVGLRKDARDLQQTRHRDAAEVADEGRAGLLKAIAAKAGNGGGGIRAQDLGRQRAGVKVTGRLAAGDHRAHRWPDDQLWREKSAGSSGTLYSTLWTVRRTVTSPATRTTAVNGTLRPPTSR